MRSLRNSRTGAVLAAATTFASGVLVAGLSVSPAQAAPVPVGTAPCASPYDLCLYSGTNFSGAHHFYNDAVSPTACHGVTGSAAGNIRSIVNKSSYAWKVYNNDRCSGTPIATIYAPQMTTPEG